MTRKHFAAIAASIAAERAEAIRDMPTGWLVVTDTLDMLAQKLARQFAAVNPRFDRERFLTACGMEI